MENIGNETAISINENMSTKRNDNDVSTSVKTIENPPEGTIGYTVSGLVKSDTIKPTMQTENVDLGGSSSRVTNKRRPKKMYKLIRTPLPRASKARAEQLIRAILAGRRRLDDSIIGDSKNGHNVEGAEYANRVRVIKKRRYERNRTILPREKARIERMIRAILNAGKRKDAENASRSHKLRKLP